MLKHRVEKSINIILDLLSLCGNPYLALSFGKDSLVCLELIRQVYPSIKCLFLKSEESFLLYNYQEVISYYVNKWNIDLKIIETQRLTENNWNWEKARKAGNKDFNLFQYENFDAVFMGLRIEESKERRFSITTKKNQVYSAVHEYSTGYRKNMFRACPVAFWKQDEIMYYLKYKNMPFLSVYNDGAFIRTTARLTGDAVRNNALFYIQKTDPEKYNFLIKKISDLKKYT